MGFFEDFQPTATDGLLEFFTVLAVYSGTVSCYVKINRNVVLQPSDYDARVVEVGTTLEALFADVGTPSKGDTFVAEGSTFTVKRIEANDEIFIKMVVTEA